LSRTPNDPRALIVLADVNWRSGNWEEATRLWKEAVKLGNALAAWHLSTCVLTKPGDASEAIALAKLAIELGMRRGGQARLAEVLSAGKDEAKAEARAILRRVARNGAWACVRRATACAWENLGDSRRATRYWRCTWLSGVMQEDAERFAHGLRVEEWRVFRLLALVGVGEDWAGDDAEPAEFA
jgi:tetratricopeptide (TPR) repeat protein